MGLMQALQNYDDGRMMAARGQVSAQEKAAAALIAEAQQRKQKELGARDVRSLSPEMLRLLERMEAVGKKGAGGKAGPQGPGLPQEYEILSQARANTPVKPEEVLAARVTGADRELILQQLAAEQAFSPRASIEAALAGINRTMGREDWVGTVARRAPEAAAAGGATAGALGLIELINYLQGTGQEPVA